MSGSDGIDSSIGVPVVLPRIKWHRYPRTPALWRLARYSGHPGRAWLLGVCVSCWGARVS
jgi:hypothetical protein